MKSFHFGKRRLFIRVPSFFSAVGILTLGKLFPKSNLLDSLLSLITEISRKELYELESPKFDFFLSSSLAEKLFIKT